MTRATSDQDLIDERGPERDHAFVLDWVSAPGLLEALGLPIDRRWNRHRALGALAAAAVVAAGEWTSYSRNHNWYAGKASRYVPRGLGCKAILRGIDALRDHGLIEEERSQPGRFGWQSRFRATPTLLARAGDGALLEHVPHEVIRLRDKAKLLIGYRDTARTHAMRRAVLELNDALASASLSFNGELTELDPSVRAFNACKRGYRVFNEGSFKAGGRLYGILIQNMRKTQRRRLLIDGAPVEEPDFQSLHPQLCYAEVGAVLRRDAYVIPGLEERRADVKLAWMMLMNARDRQVALFALAQKLRRRGSADPSRDAADLLDRVVEAHSAIRNLFFTCSARRLQNYDSELMMAVERRCLRDGIVAFPIHDSFVVARGGAADRVNEIMDDELEKFLVSLRGVA